MLGCVSRSYLRSYYGIQGSFMGDCLLWLLCPCVALRQELEHVQDVPWTGVVKPSAGKVSKKPGTERASGEFILGPVDASIDVHRLTPDELGLVVRIMFRCPSQVDLPLTPQVRLQWRHDGVEDRRGPGPRQGWRRGRPRIKGAARVPPNVTPAERQLLLPASALLHRRRRLRAPVHASHCAPLWRRKARFPRHGPRDDHKAHASVGPPPFSAP